MAIIYTYPVKATPAGNDLILISDSADSNKTKQVKISTLPGGSGSGVSSVTAVLPLASTGGSTPAISLTGLTGFGTTGQVIKVNSNADGLEWGTAGGSTSPDTPTNSVQFNNAGAFGGSADLTFSTNTLAVTHTVNIKGDGTNAGKLKLYCENTSSPHAVTIEGPAHAGAAAYTLKLPSPAPTNNQILEYTTSGNLGWINTPSGSAYTLPLATNAARGGIKIGYAQSGKNYPVLLSSEKAYVNVPWTDNNTNIANSNLQLDNNRTLDFRYDGADKSLTFINTNGGSKNLFKFEQTTGTVPYFYVGHTESAYEGYVVLEGNGSGRTGEVQFQNAAGTYYTSIKAPAAFGADQNIGYVLPNLQGAANSVLTNNGLGTLSWGTGTQEAAWTPTSPNANTISNASGKYTKVGNTVFASFAFTMTGSTSVALSGLPFSGVYTSANKGTAVISVNNCASVQGQLVGGQMATATSFIFNAYIGSGAGLPTKLQTTTSSLYQTSGGTYAGIIIYQTS